jgi:hypothetical protein
MYARALGPCMPAVTGGIRPYAPVTSVSGAAVASASASSGSVVIAVQKGGECQVEICDEGPEAEGRRLLLLGGWSRRPRRTPLAMAGRIGAASRSGLDIIL